VSSPEETKRLSRERFGAAAERYVRDRIHVEGDELDRMTGVAALSGGERVLDVATGGGHTALAFAPLAREVWALDLTPAMLVAAEQYVTGCGAGNVTFRLGDAEAIPFSDAEFDVVAARFAPHHFPKPERFLAEAARVLAPGGRLVIFDNMVPEDDELDAFMNRFEAWRDPSHVRSHRLSEWAAMLQAAGFDLIASDPLVRKRYDFDDWTAKQSMPRDERDALECWLLAAPARCREFLRITAADGRLQWLEATFGLIAGRRTEA